MRNKVQIYSLIILVTFGLNLFYYRQYLIEAWMKFSLRNEYIVVSLSTTPYRINDLKPTLDCLTQQNVGVKAIYVNVPYIFKRDNITYDIPGWLHEYNGVTIVRGEDYGPGTKLLGTLANVDLPSNAIIITVDDDALYPSNLVLHLAYAAKNAPDRAIGLLGANPDYDANGIIRVGVEIALIKIKTNNALPSILQGYAGVAYRRYFFDDSIFALATAPKDCFNSDDIFLSFYLAKHNIPRQVLNNKYINACSVNWETTNATNQHALHKLGVTADKYRNCLVYLQSQDPNVEF